MSETDIEPAFGHGSAFRGKGVDDSWKKIQERTFTNWMNDRLRGNLKVAKKQVSACTIVDCTHDTISTRTLHAAKRAHS